MEMRTCHGDVAQYRHLEEKLVFWLLGVESAAFVRLLAAGRLPVFLDNPELLELTAPDADAVVTGDAAGIDEGAQAGSLCSRESIPFAVKEFVESRATHQRALISPDRPAPVPWRDWIGIIRECRSEQRLVARNCFQSCHWSVEVRIAVAGRAEQRLRGLVLHIFAITCPMLLDLQCRVEHRRSIAPIDSVVIAVRFRSWIAAI